MVDLSMTRSRQRGPGSFRMQGKQIRTCPRLDEDLTYLPLFAATPRSGRHCRDLNHNEGVE
jgi:hypothetical protein